MDCFVWRVLSNCNALPVTQQGNNVQICKHLIILLWFVGFLYSRFYYTTQIDSDVHHAPCMMCMQLVKPNFVIRYIMQLQNYNDIKNFFHDINPKLRCHAKINGAIPYWDTAAIDWLRVFSRIRLRKAKYDNPKHVDTSLVKVILIQFIVDLTFS